MAKASTKHTKKAGAQHHITTAQGHTELDATAGSQADYDAFLPAARKLSSSEIVPMRADPQLALHNVQIGVQNVLAERERAAKLPHTDLEAIASLPRIALGLIFASTQLAPQNAGGGLRAQLARGNGLRMLLLKTADALVEAGLLPKAEVDKIRAGHGKVDAARDLVALSGLYSKHAGAVRGKHAISSAQLKEASEVGTALLKVLKPGRASRKVSGPAAGTDERDRMWTLVVRGHDDLWRAGAYLFGREVDTRVPALQASRGGRPKKAPAAVATPVAKPTP